MIYIDSIKPIYYETTSKASQSQEWGAQTIKVDFRVVSKDIKLSGNITIYGKEYATWVDAERLVKEHLLKEAAK